MKIYDEIISVSHGSLVLGYTQASRTLDGDASGSCVSELVLRDYPRLRINHPRVRGYSDIYYSS